MAQPAWVSRAKHVRRSLSGSESEDGLVVSVLAFSELRLGKPAHFIKVSTGDDEEKAQIDVGHFHPHGRAPLRGACRHRRRTDRADGSGTGLRSGDAARPPAFHRGEMSWYRGRHLRAARRRWHREDVSRHGRRRQRARGVADQAQAGGARQKDTARRRPTITRAPSVQPLSAGRIGFGMRQIRQCARARSKCARAPMRCWQGWRQRSARSFTAEKRAQIRQEFQRLSERWSSLAIGESFTEPW